jgi:hypothetical protein
LEVHDLHIERSSHRAQETVLLDHRFWLHVAMDVEETRTGLRPFRPYSSRVYGLDAAAARMVVLVEERLDRLVERSERQILVLEARERPSAARSNSRKPVRCWEELLPREAFVCNEAIERIAGTGAKELQRAHEHARHIIEIRQEDLPSPASRSSPSPKCEGTPGESSCGAPRLWQNAPTAVLFGAISVSF